VRRSRDGGLPLRLATVEDTDLSQSIVARPLKAGYEYFSGNEIFADCAGTLRSSSHHSMGGSGYSAALMLAQGWGRIVNISSSSTHSGTRRQAHYVAAKSGVNGLTKCLALEFAADGITVNAIPPGFVDTPGLRKADAEGALSIDKAVTTSPVGRPGRPEDIAAACAFLVSDEASYITGQIIGVNGGRNT
jgi:NAD(P)-dependent dehydrogenase (short-subunit alcohol dehydrogenase family)